MKIGIDIFSFDKPGENYGVGPGVYVWHLLPNLFKHGKDVQFYIFGNKENESLIPKQDNVKVIISPLPNKIRSLRVLHEQLFIPFYVKKYKIDLIHFMGNNISYFLSKKSIITIHDLMWKYYLDIGYKNLKYKYFQLTVPITIKLAKGIITVSEYIRSEIHKLFEKDSNKIISILEAPCDFKYSNESQRNIFIKKYYYKFIFTVTTSMPHKNLITLLKAFKRLKEMNIYEGKLVIAGQLKGNYHEKIISFIEEYKLENEISLEGFISEELKTFLYTEADFIVYPSLYEGFGLPVLEAIKAGNIVLASNIASIPEVGGNVCIYFNPKSVDDLFEKMVLIIKNPNLKKEKLKLSLEHLIKFSWDYTAKETINAYKYFHELILKENQ